MDQIAPYTDSLAVLTDGVYLASYTACYTLFEESQAFADCGLTGRCYFHIEIRQRPLYFLDIEDDQRDCLGERLGEEEDINHLDSPSITPHQTLEQSSKHNHHIHTSFHHYHYLTTTTFTSPTTTMKFTTTTLTTLLFAALVTADIGDFISSKIESKLDSVSAKIDEKVESITSAFNEGKSNFNVASASVSNQLSPSAFTFPAVATATADANKLYDYITSVDKFIPTKVVEEWKDGETPKAVAAFVTNLPAKYTEAAKEGWSKLSSAVAKETTKAAKDDKKKDDDEDSAAGRAVLGASVLVVAGLSAGLALVL